MSEPLASCPFLQAVLRLNDSVFLGDTSVLNNVLVIHNLIFKVNLSNDVFQTQLSLSPLPPETLPYSLLIPAFPADIT